MVAQTYLIILSHLQTESNWELFCRFIPLFALFLVLVYFFLSSYDLLTECVSFTLSIISCICIIVKKYQLKEKVSENLPASPQDPPKKPERPKKLSKKIKKKKRNSSSFTKSKYKNMDETVKDSLKTVPSKSENFLAGRTKVYSPLGLYQVLHEKYQMNESEMYLEFCEYLLTEEQRIKHRFPIESPTTPGKIITTGEYTDARCCCRCNNTFFIKNGKYNSEGVCRYHVKNLKATPGDHASAINYNCCGGNYLSPGCKVYQYHVTAECFYHDVEFVKAKQKKYLKQSCCVYALDCEMCYTTGGMEVVKVGVVSLQGLTIYETFVLPENDILDYNTRYSGVCANDLKGVTTTLADVQAYLLKLLNADTILVGHSLENDLKKLKLIHDKVVDTSVLFPHQFARCKRSLKSLTKDYLNKSIQEEETGHDCIEDARACLELVLWKIIFDLENRPPVSRDENRNAVLQNNGSFYQSLHEPAPSNYSSGDMKWKRQDYHDFLYDDFFNTIDSQYNALPNTCFHKRGNSNFKFQKQNHSSYVY